jgi:hypothetical protein
VLTTEIVDFLPKVARPANEADRDQRQSQVGGRAHGVAGENAETACVRGNLAAQRDLHREVGDAWLVDEFVGH